LSTLSKLVRNLRHRLLERTLRELSLQPVDQLSVDDVTIVAYPKSGMTWVQNLLLGARYGLRPSCVPNEMVQTLIPDVHREDYFRRFHPVSVFKSHFLPRPSYRRVVYLLRDGRDVLVSYRYFLESMQQNSATYAELCGPTASPWPSKWHEHVEQWLDNPFDAEMLLVRYEDLKTRPVAELQRICEFVGLERTPAELRQAVDQADFSNLRKQEQAHSTGGYLKGRTFFRRGEVGSFRDELPGEVLETFLAEAGETLRRCGYTAAAGRPNDAARAGNRS
jgi:hypothetical protein